MVLLWDVAVALVGQKMSWINEVEIEYITAPWERDPRLKCNS